MRVITKTLGTFILGGAVVSGSAGCVSSVRPTPSAVIAAPAHATTRIEEVPAPPPASAPPPATAPARAPIPWVNPARCLTACAFDPTPDLVRLNQKGELDARGPFRLTAQTQTELLALLQAARAAGHALRVSSTYRSYEEQARLFADIKEAGRAARPGHSEHQLGTVQVFSAQRRKNL